MLVDSKLLTDNINWHVLYCCTLTVHKNCFAKVKIKKVMCCRSGRPSTLGQTQTTQAQRFILVLPQAAALHGQMLAAMALSQHRVSSSRTIRSRHACHAQCKLWNTLLRRGLPFVQWRRIRNSVKRRDPSVLGQMELLHTSLLAIDFNSSCSKQSHSNRLGTGHGYESTELRCILTVLCVPSVIYSLSDIRPACSIQLSSRLDIGQPWTSK